MGPGSGHSSLAAKRLGARVYSCDYDCQSVACTAELKRRYYPDDPSWVVEEDSALDRDYLQPVGMPRKRVAGVYVRGLARYRLVQ